MKYKRENKSDRKFKKVFSTPFHLLNPYQFEVKKYWSLFKTKMPDMRGFNLILDREVKRNKKGLAAKPD